MKYANKFQNQTAYNTWKSGSSYVTPNVGLLSDSGDVVYQRLPKTNSHDYVDLGLPSRALWATMNVGASSASDVGYYLAWGSLWTSNVYTWNTYRFGTEDNLTKYSIEDGLWELQPEDDAAQYYWGGDWHVPSWNQWEELFDYTDHKSMYDQPDVLNGVNGIIFTNQSDSSKSIFIPFGGYKDNNTIPYPGELNYWSNEGFDNSAGMTYYNGDAGFSVEGHYKYLGAPVRGIIGKIVRPEHE